MMDSVKEFAGVDGGRPEEGVPMQPDGKAPVRLATAHQSMASRIELLESEVAVLRDQVFRLNRRWRSAQRAWLEGMRRLDS